VREQALNPWMCVHEISSGSRGVVVPAFMFYERRRRMSSTGTPFLTRRMALSVIVASVGLIPGCDGNETGSVVEKPKEAEEGERKSREGMKSIMKNPPKGNMPIKDPSKH
jgi:hypothetical protein